MSVISLKIVVASLDTVRETFDRIKVHRSVTGSPGPYVEVTLPSTRIPLEAMKVIYEYQDLSGDPNYFYRVSYFNSVSLLESSLSEPQQGESDSALDIISVEELKTNYLFGVDLTKDDGEAYPEALFEWYIKSAVSWIEARLDIPVRPVHYEDEVHDYWRRDYDQYISLFLDHYPVISVATVKMVLPTDQVVKEFDSSWIKLQKEFGHVNIIPGIGSQGTILLGASGAFLPFLTRSDFLPGIFHIDYTAGFESGKVPGVIKDIIGKLAAMGPLNIAGDMIAGAGIASQSLSMDGISQSISTTASATNAGYGARIIQYYKDIKDVLPTLQKYYKGIRLTVA